MKQPNNFMAVSAWEPGVFLTKAKGAKIWLNGRPHLDFACGPGVANIGYNHPEILETIRRVLSRNETGYGGNMILNKYEVALAEELCRLTPGKFPKKVFFSNSGGEAVEAAMLACMKRRPERRGMVSFLGDFHGRLGFCRNATTSRAMHFERMPWGIEKTFFLAFPAENPETRLKQDFLGAISTPVSYMKYVENVIGPFINDINFAIFELIQGEGGISVAQKETMRALVDYLRKNNVWVIIDEVQSGLARTGKMWASDIFEIEPDILTVAKALSGGVIPIGATIMREELSFTEPGGHCNTFGGGPLACAVGLKVLEIIRKENLAEKAETKGKLLHECLWRNYSTSGRGLMRRITFYDSEMKKSVIANARKLGLFLTGAGERSVRLMPALTISENEIKQAVEIIKSSTPA